MDRSATFHSLLQFSTTKAHASQNTFIISRYRRDIIFYNQGELKRRDALWVFTYLIILAKPFSLLEEKEEHLYVQV
jgi:hypothetical protein